MGPSDLIKMCLWGILFLVLWYMTSAYKIFGLSQEDADSDGVILFAGGSFSLMFGMMVQAFLWRIKNPPTKAELKSLNANYREMTGEKQKLEKKIEWENKKWEIFKPDILKFLAKECELPAISEPLPFIRACVELQIKDTVQDMQSFLPPSLRLSASHYAQFFVANEDMQKFTEEQKTIATILEQKLVPDYEHETIFFDNSLDDSTTKIMKTLSKAFHEVYKASKVGS